MTERVEWSFRFGLLAKAEGELVSEAQASALMDNIVEFCEERGLCVGGGFSPFEIEPVGEKGT